MTGVLCPIGSNLYLAWLSSAPQVNNASRTDVIPEKIIVQVTQQRTDDYRQALAAYRAHREECADCKEKFPCRRKEDDE